MYTLSNFPISEEIYTTSEINTISTSISTDVMNYVKNNAIPMTNVQGDVGEDNKIGTKEYVDHEVSSRMTYTNVEERLSVTLGQDVHISRLKGTLVNGNTVTLYMFG